MNEGGEEGKLKHRRWGRAARAIEERGRKGGNRWKGGEQDGN